MTTIREPIGSFTRPADTTAYAVGDLMANSTTAGSVVPVEIDLGSYANYQIFIRACRMTLSSKSVTSASFRVHLFKTSTITCANGDNGAFSTSNGANYIGAFDVTVDRAFTDVSFGRGVPMIGNEINTFLVTDKIYALVEARAAYTPAESEVITIALEIHRV